MSKPINIKFDNSLPNEEVVKALIPSSVEEGGNVDTEISEVKITGVYTPLIKFNNKVLPWEDVLTMTLTSGKFLPELYINFYDRTGNILMHDTPGPDNKVILQLIPKFDKVYKKIKMTFYISNINIDNISKKISVSCKYYCDKLYDSNIESFGKTTTYKFYEDIAHRLHLGLCSNLEDSCDDRYIYMAGDTFVDSLIREKNQGGSDSCILDAWVDWWNNINIVDLNDLYNGTPDNNLKIYSSLQNPDPDARHVDEPIEIEAKITNHFMMKNHPLYTPKLEVISSNEKNSRKGTDRAYNVFDICKGMNDSLLLQDATSVKEKVFTRFYYNGEYNSEYNNGRYLLESEYRDMFEQKIDNNKIRVKIPQICFGLMRGGKVNVEWYDDSSFSDGMYNENTQVTSNINIEDNSVTPQDPLNPISVSLNKKISGQYYIVNTEIEYKRQDSVAGPISLMSHYLTLSKSSETFNYVDTIKE